MKLNLNLNLRGYVKLEVKPDFKPPTVAYS